MKNNSPKTAIAGLAAIISVSMIVISQTVPHDPGPRPNSGANGPSYYPTLNGSEQATFTAGVAKFLEADVVPNANGGGGLGPGFNGTSCGSCHAQPTALGSSPSINPQIVAANETGATNAIPSFITMDGPVREARFVRYSDGTPDGGVHDLFTIAGRTDALGCTLAQPDFATQLAANNVIFRIPTPLFGLGLVDDTPDAVLRANLASTATQRAALNIAGRFNTSGNTGTITKFGWKAQNPTLEVFAGEAYNVEMGVTNDLFSSKRNAVAGCLFNQLPEDNHPSSDVDLFTDAMRLSAPPTPVPPTARTQFGQRMFERVGCNLCHSETLTSASSIFTGMSYAQYHPFSDFALHHMGSNLADGISQGAAAGDEFRTAPLWGVGQRLFFLHDGRTTDLVNAIQQHSSPGSEANQVIRRYNNLTPEQKQTLLEYLRSL